MADLVDAEPLELKRRGSSLTTVEVPGGSWTVGKMHSNRPAERTSDHSAGAGMNRTSDHSTSGGSRAADHGNRGVSLDVGRRRNSLSLVGHDAAAVRSSLRVGPVNIHAFAGVIGTSHASLPCLILPCILLFTFPHNLSHLHCAMPSPHVLTFITFYNSRGQQRANRLSMGDFMMSDSCSRHSCEYKCASSCLDVT